METDRKVNFIIAIGKKILVSICCSLKFQTVTSYLKAENNAIGITGSISSVFQGTVQESNFFFPHLRFGSFKY
jgi:hypothetical protein